MKFALFLTLLALSCAIIIRDNASVISSAAAAEYKTAWFTQKIDHFNWAKTDASFQQRWLFNDANWDGSGPILFYTGNEGDVTLFWSNTGFVTKTLAKELNALVVFAEHRYYGLSLPFGNQSFTQDNYVYLSSEQALADYAVLIPHIKQFFKAQKSPVISFGGSYGGMLSAWFRMKYPHVVDGAIAASAPILQFNNTGVSESIFNEIVTRDYAGAVSGCDIGISDAFKQMAQLQTKQELRYIKKAFKICQEVETSSDRDAVVNWLSSGVTYMAMGDYPYPASFLGPMPGSPVNVSCQRWDKARQQGSTNLEAVAELVNVIYNYTGQATCNDVGGGIPGLGSNAWEYQTCTEMVMPMSGGGMFPGSSFDYKAWSDYCYNTYKVRPRNNWITEYYGGALLPNGKNNLAGSNIVFSNGRLDPWRGGGVQYSPSSTMISVIIEGGAHHLDLREPNAADPQSVVDARNFERSQINKWIKEANLRNSQ